MNEFYDGEKSAKAIRATGSLLGFLPKLASAIIGMTAISYVLGRVYEAGYLNQIGASWAIGMLTSSEIMSKSVFCIVTVLIFAALSAQAVILLKDPVKYLLPTTIIIFIILSLVNLLPYFHLPYSKYDLKTLSYMISSVFLCASSGLCVGGIIYFLSQEKKSHLLNVGVSYLMISLVSGLFLTAPYQLGISEARQDFSKNSVQLPKIILTSDDKNNWHLVEIVDGNNALIVSEVNKNNIFKIVNLNRIRSIGKGHMPLGETP